MDEDLKTLTRERLVEEVARLRNAIRAHRDGTGHELCWHHPQLWGLLPEETDPLPRVPAWPELISGGVRYRQSLDEQASHGPRTIEAYGDDSDAGPGTTVASVIWRRLDAPGHDVCRLEAHASGWRLDGVAVFGHGEAPAYVAYGVACDSAWRTRCGRVRGWIGPSAVDITVARTTDSGWLLGSERVPGLEACADLDFDFTPATNLIHVRRLALGDGESAHVPAALLRLPEGTLRPLDQRYERRGTGAYWYEAPGVGYAGLLDVDDAGFVIGYPGLWRAEMGGQG